MLVDTIRNMTALRDSSLWFSIIIVRLTIGEAVESVPQFRQSFPLPIIQNGVVNTPMLKAYLIVRSRF